MVFSGVGPTHRPLSSSFLELPYRILNTNHKKELLRGLWVNPKLTSHYMVLRRLHMAIAGVSN